MEIANQIQWDKLDGLIPVVVQDYKSAEVLMVAFMNEEAFILSIETKEAHFYSRSKARIWKKGEQSGHIQKIHQFLLDCDDDTLLLKVEQIGSTCHTGNKTCFFKEIDSNIQTKYSHTTLDMHRVYGVIDTLYHTLQERKKADYKTSYTASLYHKGENTIGKKIVEEASEFAFALKDKKEEEIIYEAADLLYHTLVGLSHVNISPDRVKQEILRRFNRSGIEEKNSRKDS